MQKFYSTNTLAIYKVKLFRFLRRHYRVIIKSSYFLVLVSLCCWTLYYFTFMLVSHRSFQITAQMTTMIIFCGIGFVNFLIAYMFALVKEKQLQDLTQLIMIDELTGVYNKRYFLNKLHTEIVRARRYNHIMSLIILDIDHFKKLNDTYGHMCGDIVLRHIAKLIRSQIRVIDLVCRFGGEEFVIICPETSIHEAKTIAERIRKRIEVTQFHFKQESIVVTVSAGVNHLDPLKVKTDISLFHGADEALYVAKNAGRNRVVLYSSQLKTAIKEDPSVRRVHDTIDQIKTQPPESKIQRATSSERSAL